MNLEALPNRAVILCTKIAQINSEPVLHYCTGIDYLHVLCCTQFLITLSCHTGSTPYVRMAPMHTIFNYTIMPYW